MVIHFETRHFIIQSGLSHFYIINTYIKWSETFFKQGKGRTTALLDNHTKSIYILL